GPSSESCVSYPGRWQGESPVHESVDAAAADQRGLRCERHHVEFSGADRKILAEVLCHAEGESGVIAVSFYIGQRRVDRNERKIRPVYVLTEVMLVLHIDMEARPKTKFLCIHLKESVELTTV